MLHAIGFPDEQMPQLLAHGWWNLGGAKMSKSAGNIVDPFALVEKYGAEALRYYLMSDIATGKDADFSEQRLIERYNVDLANSLGNLLNRTLNMAAKYRSGKIRSVRFTFAIGAFDSPDNESDLAALVVNFPVDSKRFGLDYSGYFDSHRVSTALEHAWQAVNACNTLVDCAAPWKLAQLPSQAERLDSVLYYVVESLRIIAILISPVLLRAAHGIFDQLNWKMELSGKEERFSLKDAEWGRLPDEHIVGQPVPLFPRIETSD